MSRPGKGAKLVGGVYGVGIGGYFAAESMFYRVRDASKVALVALLRRLAERGYQLVDIQQLTPHTARLGASEISRSQFLERLAANSRTFVPPAYRERRERSIPAGIWRQLVLPPTARSQCAKKRTGR